jgi:deoxyribodipyrimidine photolyase-related protein
MNNFLILPNQLFEIKYLIKNKITNSEYKIILYEHPQYITKYNFNKKKLILHFSSIQYYKKYLEDNNYKVNLIKFNETLNLDKYEMFKSADNLNLKPNKEYDNPNFLLNKDLHEEYFKKTDKFIFNNFYIWSKNKLNILPNVKSTDKQNRKKMPKDMLIPGLKKINKIDNDFIKDAIIIVDKDFNKNYGNTTDFIYPVTHKSAKSFLMDFINNKFNNFGDYQDYIKKDESYMFHSILSSSINIGLINPIDIINEINKHKNKIPINSYEGYIRQLFWREYQLYCYNYIDYESYLKKPYFEYKNKINKKNWYNGTTGNEIVDDTIKKAFNTGYLHHIERLMIIGNYMNLREIIPVDGFKWFIEFSIDSYEWVMYQNVYDMVFFVTTKTMRKPYISSENYLLKMSNYKKGKWSEEWRRLYNKFLIKNKNKLWKYRYSFPTLKNM